MAAPFIMVPPLHKFPVAHLRQPAAGFALAASAAVAGLAMLAVTFPLIMFAADFRCLRPFKREAGHG